MPTQSDNHNGSNGNASRYPYPYSRREECAWAPNSVADHLVGLLSLQSSSNSNSNSSVKITSGDGSGLMSRGWTTKQARLLRILFGRNIVTTPDDDNNNNNDNDNDNRANNNHNNIIWIGNVIPAPNVRRVLSQLHTLLHLPSNMPQVQRLSQRFPCLKPILTALLSQLHEPLNLMLLASAFLSLVILHQPSDAISIFLALTIVCIVAAVQEYRSEAALEKLNDLVPHTCTVMRDGRIRDSYPAQDLVVGDLVLLGTGDRVPADCRIVDCVELGVDESSLTGENVSVMKCSQALTFYGAAALVDDPSHHHHDDHNHGNGNGNGNDTVHHKHKHNKPPSIPLTEQRNMVFMGSLICSGRARVLVIGVGNSTEFGKVASELAQVDARKSPLQVKIDELGQTLAYMSSIVIAIMALLGWCLGRPFLETVTVAVSLAVAAIPEGLPICVTVTLALGVLRMAKANAIVKKLTSVESLGCATVVASDKTGTLTQNEMTARSIYTLAYPTLSFGLTGVGYDCSKGDLRRSTGDHDVDQHHVSSNGGGSGGGSGSGGSSSAASAGEQKVLVSSMEFGAIQALFQVACLCNNASISNHTYDSPHIHPDGYGHGSGIGSESGPGIGTGTSTSTHATSSLSSSFQQQQGDFSGQPTELALLVGAAKSKVMDPRPQYYRMQEIPFSSDRKRMEVRARPVSHGEHSCLAFKLAASQYKSTTKSTTTPTSSSAYDGSLYFVKGMPEAVLGECQSHISADGSSTPFTEKGKLRVLSQSRRMASSGLRVLAMAYGPTLDALIFAGVVGMEDPPRHGVQDAVRQLHASGVNVLMVTGDSKETALAIGKRCGIIGGRTQWGLEMDGDAGGSAGGAGGSSGAGFGVGTSMDGCPPTSHNPFDDLEFGAGACLSGEQLDAIPGTRLAESILGVKIFYRVAPRHKLALVRAFQSQGEVVAMTGDGVNDAIALKAADIGVAMGKGGTDVAKEAADVVLADDDFSTIVKAVAGGKGIFFNIRNFLAFQLSTSFAALSMECIATILGLPSPLNAMQILWINIIMDGPPAQSLGVEPVDDKILKARPRKATDPLLTKALLLRAVTSAMLIVFVTLRVFASEMDDGSITRRDTTMTFMTFVNCDLFNAYACRSSDRCFYEIKLSDNPTFALAVGGSILGQLAVIYFKPLQEIFQTESLSLSDLFRVLMLSSSMLVLDTIRKKFFARTFSDTGPIYPVFTSKHKLKSELSSDTDENISASHMVEEIGTKVGKSNIRSRIMHI